MGVMRGQCRLQVRWSSMIVRTANNKSPLPHQCINSKPAFVELRCPAPDVSSAPRRQKPTSRFRTGSARGWVSTKWTAAERAERWENESKVQFWFNSRDFRRGVTHSSRFSVNFGFYSRSFLPPFEHFLRENWTRIELEIDSKLATVSNPIVLGTETDVSESI